VGGNAGRRRLVHEIQATGYTGYWGFEFLPQRDRMTVLEQTAPMLRDAL